MAIDIKDRLIARAGWCAGEDIYQEAADEIERLREVLHKWIIYNDDDESDISMMLHYADAIESTRKALSGN